MRAVSYSQNGPASVLQITNRDAGVPGPGQVAVRIRYSGINPADVQNRAGNFPVSTETVPHVDGSGVVDAIGDGVTHVHVGDRVWLTVGWDGPLSGTAQEIAVVSAERVHPLPAQASFEIGASIGVPATTAHRALTSIEGAPARLTAGSLSGKTVLVAGGAGAVGYAATRLAKWAGASVIATVSSEAKADVSRAAGADLVVRYDQPGAVEAIRQYTADGVDAIIELAPAVNAELDRAVLKATGTLAIYANERGESSPFDPFALWYSNARVEFVAIPVLPAPILADAAAAIVEAIDEFVVGDDGLPVHVYPLDEAVTAHEAVEARSTGKVLLQVS